MRVIVAGSRSWAKSLQWDRKYWQLCNRTELCCQLCISGKRNTHTKQISFYPHTHTEKSNKTALPFPLSCTMTQQQLFGDSYRERLTGRRFHCYERPWRWSRFPQTGRRNRWPQNAPHWSSEIRRPWRLSYRPPLEGGGEGGFKGGRMGGWMRRVSD